MITQFLLNWFSDMLSSLVGVLPALPAELAATMDTLPGNIQTVGTSISRLSPVLPFEVITAAFITIGIGILTALAIHLVLKILSFATMGGGAT